MSKITKIIDQAAEEWASPKFIDKYEGYDCTPQEAFIAGAKWMLQETFNSSMTGAEYVRIKKETFGE